MKINVCVHTYIHTHIYMCVCGCVCVCEFVCVCVCVRLAVGKLKATEVHNVQTIFWRTQTYFATIHFDTAILFYIYIHAYIYIYIYMAEPLLKPHLW